MKDMDLKKKVLSEIMDLMDAREDDRLKKHPKLMKAEIEVVKEEKKEDDEMTPEMMDEKEEVMDEMSEEKEAEMDIDPEMLQMLIEKMKEMK